MRQDYQFTNDVALVRQSLVGDRTAFTKLVQRHQAYIFGLARNYTSCQTTAADIAQESLIRVYQKLNTFRGEAEFSTWLFTIVRSTAYNHLAKSSRRKEQRDALPSDFFDTVDNPREIGQEDACLKLWSAVDELPATDAQLLRLFYQEEKSVIEIAKLLGCTASLVRTKLCRARRRAKSHLITHRNVQQYLRYSN